MKKFILRTVALIMCISTLISLFSCNANKNTDQTDKNQNTAKQFELGSEYYVVRSDLCSSYDEILTAINTVREAVGAVFGEFPVLTSDYRRSGDNSVNEFEILIGDTNREQSQKAAASLGPDDYMYEIESENVIVICGGSPKATLEAVNKFCLDVLGYDTETKQAVSEIAAVSTGTQLRFTADYKFKNATLNGFDLNNITVAFSNEKFRPFARDVANVLTRYTGATSSPINYKELKGDEKCVIYVGDKGVDGNDIMKKDHSGYLLTSSFENGILSVNVAASADKFYDNAVRALEKNLALTDERDTATLRLPEKDVYGYDYEDDLPIWTLKSEKSQTLADGVIYTEQVYTDAKRAPYRVYILNIDPTKAFLYMGTYNDEYVYSTDKNYLQTVAQHVDIAVSKGMNVIAATNSNYAGFNNGVILKEGVLISNCNAQRPYVGYTKDGKFVIGGDSTKIPTSTLQTAVGGSHYIVEDLIPKNLDMDQPIGYTAHPRTLAGIKEDGTLILAVIDGRQPELSNGAPLTKCADLMLSLGAVNAVNLDGGGSSTMITKIDGQYVLQNSPSDGHLRPIPASLLIIGK